MPELCATTCQLHADTRETLHDHELILNGEKGLPGVVGKLDHLDKTVGDIKRLLQWAIGIILTPVLVAIVALALKSAK